MDHLTYTPEQIIAFVRKVEGNEAAERVRNDENALYFWDFKMADWATD